MTFPSPFASGTVVTKAQLDSLGRGFMSETSAGAAVTLSTTGTAPFASSSKITFTLTDTRRVRIVVSCRFAPSGSTGRYNIEPGYNSGSSINLGSATFVGQPQLRGGYQHHTGVSAIRGDRTADRRHVDSVAGLGRVSGGTATDQADTFYIAVYDEGDS